MADVDVDHGRRGQPAHRATTRRSRRRSPPSAPRSRAPLIPVTAYIVVACAEAYLRYPEMMRTIDAAHAGRGDRPPGPPARVPGRPLLPVVDRQLLPARPQGHGDGRPAARRPRAPRPPCSTSGSGPRSPTADDGTRQAWDTGTLAHLRRRHRRRAARRGRADRRRRAPGAGQALQRHARQPPVPALLRHAGRLRRHRPVPVPGAARPLAPACATSTASRRATSRGRRSPRTCPTTTSRRRSSSTTCESTVHRLRHVEPHARGLPRPPGRLRPVHHRRAAARASCARCPPTSTTASWRRCARAQAAALPATSPPWSGTRRSAAGAYVYFTFLRPFAEIAGRRRPARLDRAPRPARAAVRAVLGHGGRERRRARGRGATTSCTRRMHR